MANMIYISKKTRRKTTPSKGGVNWIIAGFFLSFDVTNKNIPAVAMDPAPAKTKLAPATILFNDNNTTPVNATMASMRLYKP